MLIATIFALLITGAVVAWQIMIVGYAVTLANQASGRMDVATKAMEKARAEADAARDEYIQAARGYQAILSACSGGEVSH